MFIKHITPHRKGDALLYIVATQVWAVLTQYSTGQRGAGCGQSGVSSGKLVHLARSSRGWTKHSVKHLSWIINPKCGCTTAKLHLLPFYDIKVVSVVSLVNNMLIDFDCPFKHGIEDLRKLFLIEIFEKENIFASILKSASLLISFRMDHLPNQIKPRKF